jgi:hypothetical protein
MEKDLENLSDEELLKLAASEDTNPELEAMSDDELLKMAQAEEVPSTYSMSQPSTSTTEDALRGAAQGATLSFQDEGTGALEAGLAAADSLLTGSNAFGQEGRLSGIKNFAENYATSRDSERAKLEAAKANSPIATTLGEIGGSLPAAIATGGGGLASRIGASGALGAAQTLGSGSGRSLSEAAGDAGLGGGLSALIEGAFGVAPKMAKGIAKLFVKDADKVMAVGQKLGKAAANEATQEAITDSARALKKSGADLVTKAKDQVGKMLGQALEDTKGIKLSATDSFKSIYDDLGKIPEKAKASIVEAKSDLLSTMASLEDKYLKGAVSVPSYTIDPVTLGKTAGSPKVVKKTLDSIPFENLHSMKQELGEIIFDQKRFQDAPFIQKRATALYNKLNRQLNNADLASGSGGKYAKANQVYAALAKSKPEKLNFSVVSRLADKQSGMAKDALDNAFGTIMKLDDASKAMIPEVTAFLENTVPFSSDAVNVMKQVTGRAGNPNGIINKLASIVGLDPASRANALNRFAASQSSMGIAPGQAGRKGLSNLGSAIAITAPDGADINE